MAYPSRTLLVTRILLVTWALLALLTATIAQAATYPAASEAQVKALLPKLAAGDVIDFGTAEVGGFYLRPGSATAPGVEKLKGVTLKGGRFTSIRFDYPVEVTMDGFAVDLPVTTATVHYARAFLLNSPRQVRLSNFTIRASGLPEGHPRLGSGIFIDGRGRPDAGGVTLENGRFSDLTGAIGFGSLNGVTIRNVMVERISADGMGFGKSSNVLIEDFTCGAFYTIGSTGWHPDCIQVDQASGPVNDLTIRRVNVWNGFEGTQGIFAGMPFNNAFRHARWNISGVRMLGKTYRAISVMGVDGLSISDTVLLTPHQNTYFTMLTVDNSTDVTMRDNAACSHARNNVTGLVETGKITLPCRGTKPFEGLITAPVDTAALEAALAEAKAGLAKAEADLAKAQTDLATAGAELEKQGATLDAARTDLAAMRALRDAAASEAAKWRAFVDLVRNASPQ